MHNRLFVGDRRNSIVARFAAFMSCSSFQPLGDGMVGEKQAYKLTVAGPGHNFEREIDEALASQIISLTMTGKMSAEPAAFRAGDTGGGSGSHTNPNGSTPKVGGSLASYIKAKKAEKNQVRRFLVTAYWLSGRTTEALTASVVTKALLDNHQKRLANSADCLNIMLARGFVRRRKEGHSSSLRRDLRRLKVRLLNERPECAISDSGRIASTVIVRVPVDRTEFR